MHTNASRQALRAAPDLPLRSPPTSTPGTRGTPRTGPVRAHRAKTVAPTLSLAVQYACNDRDLPARPQIRRWTRGALVGNAQVTVRFVGAIEGRALNAEYRARDYATNVLTFVYDDDEGCVGDIVVCASVVRREAAAQQKTLIAHFAHLVVHGMLHLQGFDHEAPSDASAMEARETAILAGLGFADPYAANAATLPAVRRASR